ncbi:uncharacterized protein ACNLHF_007106 [Anomaloglossus baeobatrachus]
MKLQVMANSRAPCRDVLQKTGEDGSLQRRAVDVRSHHGVWIKWSELKQRMKAEKKAAEKEAKQKDQNEKTPERGKSGSQSILQNQNPGHPAAERHQGRSLSTQVLSPDVSHRLHPEIQKHLEEVVTVAGRIHAKCISGAKLIFYDLRGEGMKLQVMANSR